MSDGRLDILLGGLQLPLLFLSGGCVMLVGRMCNERILPKTELNSETLFDMYTYVRT